MDIDHERRRSFLVTQWVLLSITAISIGGLALAGAVAQSVVLGASVFFAVVGLLTAAATAAYLHRRAMAQLVTITLHLDSALGLVFFYLLGEFETPAMGLLALLIIMATLYGPKGSQWSLAASQIVTYLLLLVARETGGLSWLPYGYMIPAEHVSNPQFLALSAGAFVTATLCVAFLAGRASLDVLTSQQQLRDAVIRQTQQLAQVNAAISHDLRTPLQVVIGYSERLMLMALTDEQRRVSEEINDGAWRMAAMLESLQVLSQVSGRLERVSPVSLEVAAEGALKNLAARLEATGAQVSVAQPLPQVLGNLPLLTSLLQNLVENAIKYGNPAAPVAVVAAAPGRSGFVTLMVEDNGDGIPAADRQRVFELFLRLEKHNAMAGTGAGLAVVMRLAEAHGGTVRVEEGQTLGGARFVVELPAA